MLGKKVYGQSKQHECPFCGQNALSINEQGVPVCLSHKDRLIQNFKCACGDWLDLLKGKWGPFFRCMTCGTINFRKGLEINMDKINKNTTSPSSPASAPAPAYNTQKPSGTITSKPRDDPKKEITVRSDELDFWFE